MSTKPTPAAPRAEIVLEVIRQRRTCKIIADPDRPLPLPAGDPPFEALLEAAAWAPFHKPAHDIHRQGELPGLEPWRIYLLDAAGCRALLALLKDWAQTDPAWLQGKIAGMLAAADGLLLTTWLPDPDEPNDVGNDVSVAPGTLGFAPTRRNMEHIAAAAAAIENLVLAATAYELPCYWSSGGRLAHPELFAALGIPHREILLGAIFLFPPEVPDDRIRTRVDGGAWRAQRAAPAAWSRRLEIDPPAGGKRPAGEGGESKPPSS